MSVSEGMIGAPRDFRPSSPTPEHEDRTDGTWIARHWRGDLSLAVSYWINGFLGNVAVMVIGATVAAFYNNYEPVSALIITLLVWTATLAIVTWQAVGIWRSAGKNVARGGTRFWAVVACIMVVVGVVQIANLARTKGIPQLVETFRIVAGDDELGDFHVRLLNNGTEAEFSGAIKFGATAALEKAIDGKPVRVLHLNSHGGRIFEAEKMRDFIREKQISTVTTAYCLSACTVAFFGGRERYVRPIESRLGFHQGAFPGVTKEEMAEQTRPVVEDAIAHGVARDFMERGYGTANSEMWYPTTAEAILSGYATGVTEGQFAVSGFGPVPSRDAVRERLRADPSVRSIEKADAEVFETLVTRYTEAAVKGSPEAHVLAYARQALGILLAKNLPLTSDAALIEMMRVTVDEMVAIQQQDPEACSYFVNPDGKRFVDLRNYADITLIQRDIAATAAVLETLPKPPPRVPTQAEIDPLLDILMRRIIARHGQDTINIIAAIDSAPRHMVCPALQAMYSTALSMPRKDSVRVLRFMFAHS